jgi:hypothetical protein
VVITKSHFGLGGPGVPPPPPPPPRPRPPLHQLPQLLPTHPAQLRGAGRRERGAPGRHARSGAARSSSSPSERARALVRTHQSIEHSPPAQPCERQAEPSPDSMSMPASPASRLARCTVGPLPMERPHSTTCDRGTPSVPVKCWNACTHARRTPHARANTCMHTTCTFV